MRSLLQKDTEDGFSLAELLVVIIIIGILAAIAIPVYLNQRQQAFRAEARSDLAGIRTQVMDQLIDGASLTDGSMYLTAMKQAGVWGSVSHDVTVVTGKTFAFCGNETSFAVAAYSTYAGGGTQMFYVTSDEGVIKKLVYDPAATGNGISKFCMTALPSYTYADWAHGGLRTLDNTPPSP